MPDETVIFVISDLHLGDGGPRDNFALGDRQEQLNLFLDYVAGQNGGLVVLGDLFEFWQASVGRLLMRHEALLNRLNDMEALYILGNHDADLEALIGTKFLSHPFFSRMSGPVERTIGGKRFKFMHGHEVDEFNKGDSPSWGRMMAIFAGICEDKQGSPMLGSVTVEDALSELGELLLDSWNWLANRYASDEAHKTKDVKNELTPAQNPDREQEMLRKWAEDRQKGGYDIAIVGHTHQPKAVDGWYFNSGSWVRTTNTFLQISPAGEVELFSWENGTPKPNTNG